MVSSLRPFDRIADRIKLARQQDRRSVIVVEGSSDRLFVGRIFTDTTIEVYVAGTRSTVLDAARDIDRLHIDRAACVVDRDFDDLVGIAESQGLPIASYDNADLEAMLWCSLTLEDLVHEIGSEEKISQLGGVSALRRQTFEVLRPLSKLRRANALHGWGLSFEDLNLSAKLDLRTLTLGVQPLCDSVWHPELGVDKSVLYQTAEAHSEPLVCPQSGSELIRGRDALTVVGVALRRLIGNLTQQQAVTERLEETLRLAATEAHLSSTFWLSRVKTILNL